MAVTGGGERSNGGVLRGIIQLTAWSARSLSIPAREARLTGWQLRCLLVIQSPNLCACSNWLIIRFLFISISILRSVSSAD